MGESHDIDMTQVDLNSGSVPDVTISIHHYLTDSELGRYQILFNGTTVAHLEKRFPGPAIRIGYQTDARAPGGPRSWLVDVYQLGDLLPEERLALGPGKQVDIGQCSCTLSSLMKLQCLLARTSWS